MKRVAVCALGLVLFAAAGCGGDGSVTGTVTLDGRPVATGAVTFVKTEGGHVRAGAVIKDGTFQILARLPPGKYRVEVNGQKVVGKRKQPGFDGKEEVIETTEELFPERYNTKSELSERIQPGANVVKLDLNSKK